MYYTSTEVKLFLFFETFWDHRYYIVRLLETPSVFYGVDDDGKSFIFPFCLLYINSV